MIAAHLDSLLFLLLVAVAVFFQFLAKTAGKTDKDQTKSTPTPGTPTPMRRAPTESDEDRIRKLLEALGQPPTSRPPPSAVPRTPRHRRRRGSCPRRRALRKLLWRTPSTSGCSYTPCRAVRIRGGGMRTRRRRVRRWCSSSAAAEGGGCE